LASYNI